MRSRHDRTRLYLAPADSAENLFVRHLARPRVTDEDQSWNATIARTHVRVIDSLNAVFSALKQAALARRGESLAALIDRLGDDDADVARLAHSYLKRLTGQQLPGGRDGIVRWRRCLNDSQ